MTGLHFGKHQRDLDLSGLWRAAPQPVPAASPGPELLAPLCAALREAKRPVVLVPDHTRGRGCLWPLPPLLKAAQNAVVLVASGTHRPMDDAALSAHLPAGVATERCVVHDADRAPMAAVGAGAMTGRVHRAVAEADVVVAISQMVLHYLAGFGGGRKMLFPGVADRDTARWVHAASIDPRTGERPPLVAPGTLEKNPLHERIRSLCRALPGRLLGVCSVLDGDVVVDAAAGALFAHHAQLAARYRPRVTATVTQRPHNVIVSAGPASSSRSLVQAHKALLTASRLCAPSGRILLLAGLPRPMPDSDMERLVCQHDAAALRSMLREQFAIARQTAWSFKDIVERFDVSVCSRLDASRVSAWGVRPISVEGWDEAVDTLRGRDTAVLDGRTLLFDIAHPA